MPKIYATSEVMAGATRIKVRQVLLTGDASAPPAIVSAATAARSWLQTVIPIRPSDTNDANIAPIFRFFFHAEPSLENTNIVWAVLHLIQQGLEQPFSVKISNSQPTTAGYVKQYWAPCPERDGQIYMWNEDDKTMRRKGEIHVYRGILADTDLTAITLIHEAGHRFANLNDFGKAGYFQEDYSGMDQYDLEWSKCMRNADSYAAFVYFLANPTVANTLITTQMFQSNENKIGLGMYG